MDEFGRCLVLARVGIEAVNALRFAQQRPYLPQVDGRTRREVLDFVGLAVNTALQGVDPVAAHAEWCRVLRAQGWVYGRQTDFARKVTPWVQPHAALYECDRDAVRVFLRAVRATARDLPGVQVLPALGLGRVVHEELAQIVGMMRPWSEAVAPHENLCRAWDAAAEKACQRG